MTDREAIMAVFRAVATIHQRLTGEPLTVSVETDQGMVLITEAARPATLSRRAEQESAQTMRFEGLASPDEAMRVAA